MFKRSLVVLLCFKIYGYIAVSTNILIRINYRQVSEWEAHPKIKYFEFFFWLYQLLRAQKVEKSTSRRNFK